MWKCKKWPKSAPSRNRKPAIKVQKTEQMPSLLQLTAFSQTNCSFSSIIFHSYFFSAIRICNSRVNADIKLSSAQTLIYHKVSKRSCMIISAFWAQNTLIDEPRVRMQIQKKNSLRKYWFKALKRKSLKAFKKFSNSYFLGDWTQVVTKEVGRKKKVFLQWTFFVISASFFHLHSENSRALT